MLPVSLKLKGFYSYQSEQTIDFTKLTKSGLFGIFGETGSGKSAIIEAIIFALYGESNRLLSSEKRAYNMLNLQSDELFIEFICFSDFTKTEYKITVSVKRTKQFEKVGSITRTIYKSIDNLWVPVNEDVIASEVTGVSYSNFIKTVIIPQGSFIEFLHLTPAQRTDVLKELFSLHKYELFNNVSSLYAIASEKKATIEGALIEIGVVSEQGIADLQTHIDSILEHGRVLRERYNLENASLQFLLQQKSQLDELTLLRNRFTVLIEQADEFAALEVRTQKIQEALQYFSNNLQELQLHKTALSKSENQKELLAKQNLELENQIIEAKNQYNIISKEFEHTFILFQQTSELDKICDVKQREVQIKNSTKELQDISQKTNDLKASIEGDSQKIGANKIRIQDIKAEYVDVLALHEVRSQLLEIDRLRNEIQTLKSDIQEGNTRLAKIETTISEIALFCKADNASITDSYLQNQYVLQKVQLEEIEKKIHVHEIQHEINFLKENLHEGIACPICGSEEHPNTHLKETQAEDFSGLYTLKSDYQQKLQSIVKYQATLEQILQQKQIELSKKTNLQSLLQDTQKTLQELELKNKSQDINWCNNQIKQQSIRQENVTKLEKEIEELEKKQVEILEQKNKYNSQLQLIEQDIAIHKAFVASISKEISEEVFHLFLEATISDLQQEITKRKNLYSTMELQKNKCQLQITELQQSFSIQSAQIETLEVTIAKGKLEIVQLEKAILALLSKTSFASVQEVESTLLSKDEFSVLLQKLEQYKSELTNVREQIALKEVSLKDYTYNAEAIQVLQESVKAISLEIETKLVEHGESKKKLELEKDKFKRFIDKQKELVECEHELSNLKTMYSLFKGSGFVKYMSLKYMQMLVDIANKRFMKLTKHSLRLEVENEAFCVRDYFNNGKIRHIKTLSGGQSFQAALSLALALSETMYLHSPIASNFFFIDEGFGSQDKESLEIVFETLRSLQNEGKIVGVISHVEELKENIVSYLQVTNSAAGSIIQ